MNTTTIHFNQYWGELPFCRYLAFMVLLAAMLVAGAAGAAVPTLTVTGVNSDGSSATVTGYRWLIEEDTTYNIVPGETCQPGHEADCISLHFHKSYMPVVAEGHYGDPLPDLDATKRYFISVLPDSGYNMAGTQLKPGQSAVSISVNQEPFPTAQIRVFVFNDNAPINNIPDTPEETGLAGFNILIEDAGGHYGISAGQILNDAFGNPLGTTYDAAGNVVTLGDGTITTDADGYAVIKNLVPGKYGIQAVPPTQDANGNPTHWMQTATIEGTKINDAWVKPNEPPFFSEFGPPGPHVFIGFVQEFADNTALSGGATITGQIRSIHNSRPPDFTFHTGAAVPGCMIGLNDLTSGAGRGVYAAPCNGDSTFSIPNVPDGSYQLAIWDENLDYIFGTYGITVQGGQCNGGSCNLLDVPVYAWFGRIEQYVFSDDNGNGFWDEGEQPMPDQGTNIRWRDGTIYQSFPTDLSGEAPYDEVFPFFNWMVAEVNYDRFKATGVTVVVDAGGPINPADPDSYGGVLNPQPQSENGGLLYRTETGPALLEGVQTFLGQTNILMWGKKPYDIGENGGITGIVFYAVTRAENNPQYAGAEVWEPGIPRIQVALYEDNLPAGGDGVIDDLNGDGCPTIADVDNYPFGNFPGTEDFDYPALDSANNCLPIAGSENGVFDAGDAVQITTTDSWDDNVPTGCQGDVFMANGSYPTDCYDGLRNFNQVRPAVFDGGYAFSTYVPGGVATGNPEVILPKGIYIVATGDHRVYKTLKEEDRNVDFGIEFTPNPELLPPVCVGDLHTVPNAFSLFPLTDENGAPVTPYKSGQQTPLCDRKQVLLTDGKNAAADFFMFTDVPIAAHVTGFILDDLSNEFDPNSPTFGEKYSPPYLPVSIRDWKGVEYARTYSDRWGTFNALLPSTYTTNVPMNSGMSPNMITTCMNDPGPIPDGNGGFMTDPNYNPQYSQFCYTFDYMPGITTYLDTPVLPVAAFTGPNQQPLDCQDQDGTPVIWSVIGSSGFTGPYVSAPPVNGNQQPTADGSQSITITAATDPNGVRDFGFGSSAGTVTIGGTPLTDVAWAADGLSITATVPAGTTTGELVVTRADNGKSTLSGITVTVGGPVVQVASGGSIQNAIDLANPGDLVLVAPGTYKELVIMYKPVKLQGSGASTVINGAKTPADKLANWRQDVETLFNQGKYSLLPAQGTTFGVGPAEPAALGTEQGPAIIVLGSQGGGPNSFHNKASRIDGFGITGSDAGGIIVNGYAEGLEMSNNRIFGNNGIYGGGIRVGHPFLTADNISYQSGFNPNINIHDNVIAENGGLDGYGGGISLYHGSDQYTVAHNFICGNFSAGGGGGVAHYGLSGGYAGSTAVAGTIADNTIIFNESFNQGVPAAGGGILVAGAPGLAAGSLTPGAGPVRMTGNLIQGNQAGAGDGGGIRLENVNGNDVAATNNVGRWYPVDIVGNVIVNNATGLAGGGISLQDAVRVNITNNTVAHNDSTATAGEAFAPNSPNMSTAQPAGIVSHSHSAALDAAIPSNRRSAYGDYAKPTLSHDIIWRNRSFYFSIDNTQAPPVFGLNNASPYYQDLAVLGATGQLDPRDCLLTDASGYDASNIDGSGLQPGDLFVASYVNTGNGQTIQQTELTTTIATQPAFDEGGNYIQVSFGPLYLSGDYTVVDGAFTFASNPNLFSAVALSGTSSGGGGGGGGWWLPGLLLAVACWRSRKG